MSTFKSSSVRIFAAFVAVGIICLQADAAVIDDSVFRYQMSIKPASGMVTTTLANFPVLVRLSAENLENFDPAQCGMNGANLRFALADGTLLAHEIDYWNTNGESTVWVNVPSLTADTEIVAYWSLRNGKTAPAVTASDTWPNFVAVYHFSEETGAIGDSSANHYASTNALATVSNTTAKVGLSRNMAGGKFLTGVTNLLSSSAAKPITTVSKFTVSGWMKETTGTSAGYRTLFNKGGSQVGWYQNTPNNLTQMTASGSGTTLNATTIPSGASIYSQWCYFIMAYDGGTVYHYINGSSLGGKSVSAVTANTTYQLSVSGGLTGMIDEMRIQDGTVSSAWAAADYANQATTTFLDYGEVTAKNPPFVLEAIPTQTYLGAAVEPTVVVKDVADGHVLTNGTDYAVSFDLNDGPGNGRVTVTGVPDTAYADGLLNASFTIVNGPWHVTDYSLGTEGHGFAWESPVSLSNAVARALAGDTILCKAGEYTVGNQIVIAQPVIIKGGYAGTDDTTLAADPVTTFNARDNTAFYSMVNVTTATGAGTSNHFERITFTRGYVRGLNKSGAADISFKDCRFYQNGGLYNTSGGFTGVGANLTGTSVVEARFEACLFDNNARTNWPGNRTTCMQGALYATGFKRLYVDNCNFYTNCAIFGISNEYGQDSEGVGAIYANAQPATIRGCRFVGNNVPARGAKGGTLRLNGNCNGSVLSNCVFTANSTTGWSTTLGAPLAVSMDDDARTVEIWGCTFAYNCALGTTSAAGLTVAKGAARIRNSIFYENYVSGRTAHYGADVCALGTSYLDIDCSLVTASDDDHLSCYTAANLTLGDHMVYGNPLFGTTSAAAAACRSGITFTRSKLATILAFNLHENALGTGYSPALDTGDPSDPYANEPGPNGGRVNLGAYANTAEAATSSAGAPSIQDDSISIDFAADTKPTVSFTLGGLTNYNATVKIEIATNDFELGGVVAHESSSVGGKQAGNVLSLAASDLYQPGSTLYVRVTVSAAGQPDVVKYASATVTGDLPAHYGHGGGASVMHIREGASGFATGENWTDACPDLNSAIVAMTSAKTEIWIAGKITPAMAPKTLTAQSALVIRGGFTGVEDRADQRPADTYARLYGNGAYSLFVLSNAESCPVTIERVIFDRASSRGLYKSGAGTLDVVDCKFHSNGWPDTKSYGRGIYLAGGSRVSVTNCDFRGNFMSGGGSSSTKGAAIYANAVTRLYLDDSTFVTNGCNPVCGIAGGMSGRDQCGGGLLLMDGVPLTARNCRFTSNRTPIRADGGVIWLGGTSATSAFTNCVFAGNQSTYAETSMARAATGATGGMIVINLSSSAAKVDFERCTIAYNLGDALHVPGGIDVVKGAVNLHNSIIFSNVRGKLSDAGSDIEVKASGTLNMSYCRLTEEGETTGVPSARTVHEATSGSITYDNLSFGDPTFSTSAQSFTNVLRYSGDYTYYDYSATGLKFTSSIDAHLLSKQGYWDNANVFHDDTKVVSTCIDAGDPASDYANEPQPNGHRVNLGAYGNTPYASMTPLTGSLIFIK